MPKLSAWAIRSALIYLMLGFSFGGLLLANKGIPYSPQVWLLLPFHVEFLLIGWFVQLALGVAFWILPRFPGGSRGNTTLAWLSIWLLNAGILLAVCQGFAPAFLIAGRLTEMTAGVLFAIHSWGRIKPLYTLIKSPKGQSG
jgi:hypothetical protein